MPSHMSQSAFIGSVLWKLEKVSHGHGDLLDLLGS